MAEIATLARPYARATFDLAKQNNELQTWSNMLTTLNLAIAHGQVAEKVESPTSAREISTRFLLEFGLISGAG